MRAGVGNVFAGDVGSSAAGRFVESERVAEAVVLRAETGGGEHAEGAADDGHFVGKDVAEHVFGEDHVELVRVAGELHGGVVDIHVGQLDFGGVFGDVIGDGFAPKNGGFEDVGFVDGADAFATGLGGADGDFGDALDFALFINHCVDGLDVAVVEGGGLFRLAEIDAAGEFADADDVDAFRDALGFERGGVDEFAVEEAGADVGEEGKVFAEREEGGALGLFFGREFFPFRAADGAEEDGVGGGADFERFWRKRLAVAVDGDAADIGFLVIEAEAVRRRQIVQKLEGHCHDLRTDAISRKNCKFKRFH